jgi:hypothetical protein
MNSRLRELMASTDAAGPALRELGELEVRQGYFLGKGIPRNGRPG